MVRRLAVERHLFSEYHNPLCSDRPYLPRAFELHLVTGRHIPRVLLCWSARALRNCTHFYCPVRLLSQLFRPFSFRCFRESLRSFGLPFSLRTMCNRCLRKFSLTFRLLMFSICFRCASLSFSLLFSLTFSLLTIRLSTCFHDN